MKIKSFIGNLPLLPESDTITMGKLDGYTMAAPKSFWACPVDIREEIVNGCGPGGFGDFMVPDTVYFLSIKPACKIHDWMFVVYNNEAGFKLANQIFLDNMERINRAETSMKWLRILRSKRIQKYFKAVRDFGRLFYYDAHEHLYETDAVYA